MTVIVYLPGAFFVLTGFGLGAYLVRGYLRTERNERRGLTRPLVVALLQRTSITLIGIIMLLAGIGTIIPMSLIYILATLFLLENVLRWRWRRSFPEPGPEGVRIRRRLLDLTRGLGIVFLVLQGVLLFRDGGLTNETPIWPGMVGLSFLVAALIYYLQGRRDRRQNAGSR